jgi:archaellum biogenesis protein FlaJ (TadC family)
MPLPHEFFFELILLILGGLVGMLASNTAARNKDKPDYYTRMITAATLGFTLVAAVLLNAIVGDQKLFISPTIKHIPIAISSILLGWVIALLCEDD